MGNERGLIKMNKKAQGEVITIVLIILLVLAAVIIIWQVVQNTMNKGKTGVETGTACIGLTLKIDSIVATNATKTVNITYSRGSDSLGDLSSIKVIIANTNSGVTLDSKDFTTTDLASTLGQKTISYILGSTIGFPKEPTYEVRLAPNVGGNQCDVAATKTFKAS